MNLKTGSVTVLRFGNISEVDASTGRARVSFGEDGLVSPWMSMVVPRTKGDQFSTTFDVKEQVACLMDERGRSGVILGAIYSEEFAPSSDAGEGVVVVNFSNGDSVKYDKDSGAMDIKASGGVTIQGDLTIQGDVDSTGTVTGTTDVKAGPLSVSLSTHTHQVAGVQSGSGTIPTNPPL